MTGNLVRRLLPRRTAAPAPARPLCAHLEHEGVEAPTLDEQCQDCRALGEAVWAHLRKCLTCGHVACCDSSPHRHATAHYERTGHPVMRSYEPGESWRWCYVDAMLAYPRR